MEENYKVGELVDDANSYDRRNTFLSDLLFYKKWLFTDKTAHIFELCYGTGWVTIPLAREGVIRFRFLQILHFCKIEKACFFLIQ